jgi:hypothetical protein
MRLSLFAAGLLVMGVASGFSPASAVGVPSVVQQLTNRDESELARIAQRPWIHVEPYSKKTRSRRRRVYGIFTLMFIAIIGVFSLLTKLFRGDK